MRDIQPMVIAGAIGKFFARRVPLHRLPVVVRQIHQVAEVCGARADLDVADRFLPAANGRKPVAQMVGAAVESDLGVLQVLLLHTVQLVAQRHFTFLNGPTAYRHRDAAAINLNHPFFAEKGDVVMTRQVSMKSFNPAFVPQPHSILGGLPVCRRYDFIRARLVHA